MHFKVFGRASVGRSTKTRDAKEVLQSFAQTLPAVLEMGENWLSDTCHTTYIAYIYIYHSQLG